MPQYPRYMHDLILQSLQNYPVTILTGPRQTGKSTEVYSFTQQGFSYVSLDDIDFRTAALADPKFFLELHQPPLIIDEVQYAPALMEVIEAKVNRKRLEEGSANGMYILTGSQTYELMKGVSQSLAGRANILHMQPLSSRELSFSQEKEPFIPSRAMLSRPFQNRGISDLFEQIVRGCFPELHRNPGLDPQTFYRNYVGTYLNRDLKDLIHIQDSVAFSNFLEHLATLTSQQINYSTIANHVGVSVPTIKSWISVLQLSGLIWLLEPYAETKLSKRIVKSPKLYFTDTGLAAWLAKVYSAEHLAISSLAGAFMETWTVNEIRKSYLNAGYDFPAFYYRDSNQNEIDLILTLNRTLYRIEIKKGISFNMKAVRAFHQLDGSELDKGVGLILCNTDRNYFLDSNTYVINIECI